MFGLLCHISADRVYAAKVPQLLKHHSGDTRHDTPSSYSIMTKSLLFPRYDLNMLSPKPDINKCYPI